MMQILTGFLLTSGLMTGLGEIIIGFIRQKKNPSPSQPPFSVIVAARNEAANLPYLLHCLSAQSYPEFELILVLDRCKDESKKIAGKWKGKFRRIEIIEISELPKGWSAKKFALTQGIAKASNEWLAFTDADCLPPPGWLEAFSKEIQTDTELVLGISPPVPEPGILNRFEEFETARAALLYLGFANAGIPWMGVGRSLAYRKSFFNRIGGFESHKEILTGDDDLTISRHASAHSIRTADTCPVPARFPSSIPSYIRQKTRHLSSSIHYPIRIQAWVGGLNLLHAFFYLSLFVSVFFGADSGLIAAAWLIRNLMGMMAFKLRFRWFSFATVMMFPVMDALLALYHFVLWPAGFLKKSRWK